MEGYKWYMGFPYCKDDRFWAEEKWLVVTWNGLKKTEHICSSEEIVKGFIDALVFSRMSDVFPRAWE